MQIPAFDSRDASVREAATGPDALALAHRARAPASAQGVISDRTGHGSYCIHYENGDFEPAEAGALLDTADQEGVTPLIASIFTKLSRTTRKGFSSLAQLEMKELACSKNTSVQKPLAGTIFPSCN